MKDKIRVALAEDVAVLRNAFSDIVRKSINMQLVSAVATGKEIVDVVIGNSIDIVLMDIEMETQLAGIDAAKEILRLKPFVKIIFLTSHTHEDIIKNAMGLGATDFVTKSNESDKIRDKIINAYNDKVELELTVQRILQSEYTKIKKNELEVVEIVKNITELTRSEKEVMLLLLEGKNPKEISNLRVVEIGSTKRQIGHILKKFNVKRTKEIVNKINTLELNNLF